jgi:type 1 glutamine amidotransferase
MSKWSAWGVFAAFLVAGCAAADPIKVLFVTGGGYHDFENLPPILVSLLDTTGDFEVTLTKDLSELTKLDPYDAVMFYTQGGELTRAQERGLWDFVDKGGGYVGIHCATDSFKDSDKYWQLTGGRFTGHGSGTFQVKIVQGGPVPQITRGINDFWITDETYNHEFHKKSFVQVLARRADNEPVAWVQQQNEGRVFVTGLGHDKHAWGNEGFQRLVVSGLYWAAGKTPSAGALNRVEWGFRPLFNGKDLTGWAAPSDAWTVQDRVIDCKGGHGGWLRSDEEFEDFEFRFDYRISKDGNSGAFFRATLEGNPAFTGHEVQILDDHGKPPDMHSAGSLYDAMAPARNMSKPAWEWNEVSIKCVGRQLTITMNGYRIINVNLDDVGMNHPLAEEMKMWNRAKKGYLGFQDHGSRVQFRNLRVKEFVKAPQTASE